MVAGNFRITRIAVVEKRNRADIFQASQHLRSQVVTVILGHYNIVKSDQTVPSQPFK
jgi:hypothetical protein